MLTKSLCHARLRAEMSCRGKWQNFLRISLLLFPVLAFVAWIFLTPFILDIAQSFPKCVFREITGFLCPACGNTHSAVAMLQLDFVTAVRANLFLPCLSLFLLVGYVEVVLRVFGHSVRLLPRKPVFYWSVFVFFSLYWILRNIPLFDFLRI